jgi:hypothetical protein
MGFSAGYPGFLDFAAMARCFAPGIRQRDRPPSGPTGAGASGDPGKRAGFVSDGKRLSRGCRAAQKAASLGVATTTRLPRRC